MHDTKQTMYEEIRQIYNLILIIYLVKVYPKSSYMLFSILLL